MSYQAGNFHNYEFDIDYNDNKLNLKYLNKYFEINNLDKTLEYQRNEFKTRTEHLQKRQEALHEKEIAFKEKILNYEMYIKELAIKHVRALKRIDDEKIIRKNKQIEIDSLKKEIQQIEDEKEKLKKILLQYQPHLNLLSQIVDQTDRFHSIDEMIEKFDLLYASYQDILMTIKNSNKDLNNLQQELLIRIEKKNSQISLMNNRIHELEENLFHIQQRIEQIQIDIKNYQQISTEYLTDNGAIYIAIESMFDLIKRYSHRSRRKEFNFNNQDLLNKLKHIDTFLSDLIYYVDYGNNKQKKMILNQQSSRHILDEISNDIDNNNQWRSSCQINQREISIKHEHQPYLSYKIRGEDDRLYTIQMINIDKSKISQTRQSLLGNRSSISMILRNKEKKKNSLTSSTPKLQRSIDTQPRLSTTQSIHPTFKLSDRKSINEEIPFSKSELTRRTSILTNEK